MLEVPKHLLPHLHYAEVGYIKGDTPEAQAFIDKNGLNTGALKEFWEAYDELFAALQTLRLYIFTPAYIFERTFHWFIPQLNFFLNERALAAKLFSLALLKNEEHQAQIVEFLTDDLEKLISSQQNRYTYTRVAQEAHRAMIQSIIKIKDAEIADTDFIKAIWDSIESKNKIATVQDHQIKELQINNYFCIKDLNFGNIASNEVYILGRNGDGKTLILQAIVFALRYAAITLSADKGVVGKLLEYLDKNPELVAIAKTLNGEILSAKSLTDIFSLYAYGAHRHQHTASPNDDDYDSIGFLTLFENNRKLFSPNRWLLDTRAKELEAKESGQEVAMTSKVAKSLLESLLNDEEEDQAIKIEIDGIKQEVYYTERNAARVGFDQLSSGYQSVMVWVADLVARMSEAQPYAKSLRDFEAIVLVDEVGLHLHPTWEYTIMRKLRRHFPKIQFIVTTHSPVLLMGASPDAIIYKIQKEEGQTQIVGTIKQEQLSKMMANQIITSPLFGLDRTAPPNFDSKNATDSDFIEAKIHEAIRRRLAERNTLDDEEIMRWIQEELDNLPPIE